MENTENYDVCDCPKKTLDECSRQELDDNLDLLAHWFRQLLDARFEKASEIGFIITLGSTDYRGTVTDLKDIKKIPELLRRAADKIEAGQIEW